MQNHVQPEPDNTPADKRTPPSARTLGVQFIPDADRQQPINIYNYENRTDVLNNSQTLGRFVEARQKEPPFNRSATWFYDYFPMNVQLDIQTFNAWAGSFCIPSNGHNNAKGRAYQRGQATKCDAWLAAMYSALEEEGGQTAEIDYVRVYQQENLAKDFRPLILNGVRFYSDSEVRLYKTAAIDANTPFEVLEAKPWNSQDMVVMIKPSNETFVGTSKEGFIRVVNFSSDGQEAISNAKRIVFGQTEYGTIRTNRFSHRYAIDQMNTEILPGAPPRIIKEGNSQPRNPFSWSNNSDQLNVDLFNIPALGGAARTETTFPVGYSSLPRLEQTRGKWDMRFLDAAGQQIGTTRTLPTNATPTAGLSWRLEGTSQYRNNINDPAQHVFKAVRLSESDPGTVNVVTQMADAQYPNGYYPSCADLIEVTARLATPPATAPQLEPTDLYDPVNLCGPFTVRWYLDPKPQIAITSSAITGDDNNRTATIGVRINTSPMIGDTTGSSYSWERQIGKNNTQTNRYDWSNWLPINTIVGGANNGRFDVTGLVALDRSV